MIFALTEGVRAELMTRGFPALVLIGPERPTTRRRHSVVLERDRDADETIGAPRGVGPNPARVFVRSPRYVARVYANEAHAAAMSWEHDREMDKLVDGVIAALDYWAKTQGAIFEPTGGRALRPEEIEGAETSTVACYELRFAMLRSVNRMDYDGSARDTATIHDVISTTRVSLDGDTFEEIE